MEALPDSGSADPRIIVLMREIANQLDSILAQAAKPLASTASRRSASLGTRAVHRGFLRQRHQDEQQRGEPQHQGQAMIAAAVEDYVALQHPIRGA